VVDSMVLGPGEKLIAVASTSKAVNSCQFMALTLAVKVPFYGGRASLVLQRLFSAFSEHFFGCERAE
jgi:hypothetical protein